LRTETAASFFPKEVHKFKKDIKTLPHSVVWADCCPKNILIAKKNKDNANNKNNPKNRNSRGAKNDICFIDLEFAHYNAPVIDVGFFIAHILLFAVKNKRYLADMQEGINEFIGSYHHELIKAKYTKRSADKIIRLSFNYAGIIMLHKAYSAAKYKEYSEKKIRKEIKKTAADLISNKTSL
ncbi:TPA: hypothetical protein HA246_05885, partial [Candidatus Woesearchaeota archaeon]|nr:hypothetical protein [Candidatus Woesearchaeota archaeon]